MSARLYSNENFDRRVVDELRRLGHDVLTSLEAGRANQRIPDEDVIAYAKSVGRAVITFNRLHFKRLHLTVRGGHSGIIVCSPDRDFGALALRVHEALTTAGKLEGVLLAVNRPG